MTEPNKTTQRITALEAAVENAGGFQKFYWTNTGATVSSSSTVTYSVPEAIRSSVTIMAGDGMVFYRNYSLAADHTTITFSSEVDVPAIGARLEFFYSEDSDTAAGVGTYQQFQWTDNGATCAAGTLTYSIPIAAQNALTLIPGDGQIFYQPGSYSFNAGKTQVTFNALDLPDPGAPIEFYYSSQAVTADIQTLATTTTPGLMSVPDKLKLDNLAVEIGKATGGPAGWHIFNDMLGEAQHSPNISGSGNVSLTMSEIEHPGIAHLSTGTTNTSYAAIVPPGTLRLGGGVITFEALVKPIDVSGGYKFMIGVASHSGGEVYNGVYFDFQPAASSFWRISASNGGTRTNTVCSAAPQANTWTKLKIVTAANGSSAEFFVNGTSVGTVSTNMPGNNTDLFWYYATMYKSVGVLSVSAYIDYVDVQQTLTVSR